MGRFLILATCRRWCGSNRRAKRSFERLFLVVLGIEKDIVKQELMEMRRRWLKCPGGCCITTNRNLTGVYGFKKHGTVVSTRKSNMIVNYSFLWSFELQYFAMIHNSLLSCRSRHYQSSPAGASSSINRLNVILISVRSWPFNTSLTNSACTSNWT